jgi:hypothetical protein
MAMAKREGIVNGFDPLDREGAGVQIDLQAVMPVPLNLHINGYRPARQSTTHLRATIRLPGQLELVGP